MSNILRHIQNTSHTILKHNIKCLLRASYLPGVPQMFYTHHLTSPHAALQASVIISREWRLLDQTQAVWLQTMLPRERLWKDMTELLLGRNLRLFVLSSWYLSICPKCSVITVFHLQSPSPKGGFRNYFHSPFTPLRCKTSLSSKEALNRTSSRP